MFAKTEHDIIKVVEVWESSIFPRLCGLDFALTTSPFFQLHTVFQYFQFQCIPMYPMTYYHIHHLLPDLGEEKEAARKEHKKLRAQPFGSHMCIYA